MNYGGRRHRLGVARTSVVISLGALLFVPTGCMKINYDVHVNKDDSLSGTAVMVFDGDTLAALGMSPEKAVDRMLVGAQKNSDQDLLGFKKSDDGNIRIERYATKQYSGIKYVFSRLPLGNFNRLMRFARVGHGLRSLSLSMPR